MGPPELSAHLPDPLLYLLLLALALLAAGWAYPRSAGLASERFKRGLAILRALTILFLGLLLLDPRLTRSREVARPMRLAVLADASASMSAPGSDGRAWSGRLPDAPWGEREAGTQVWRFAGELAESGWEGALEGPLDGGRSDLASARR